MFPPEEVERAAREAHAHIQMAIEAVEIASGEARLSGSVVRVFRGDPGRMGKPIRLSVACSGPGEDEDWAPDGVGRFTVAALRTGRVLEAYVIDSPSGAEIPAGLCALIDVATTTPQIQMQAKTKPTTGGQSGALVFAIAAAVAAAVAFAWMWLRHR